MSRLAIAVCLLFAWANSVFGQTPAPSSNVIVTQGEAIVKRPPDRAWLTVATEARDPRAEEARKRNAEAMTTAQAALKSAGVPADALRTLGVSVSPEYDYNNGNQLLRGFRVQNIVTVKIRDIDTTSQVVDDAVTAGGDNTSIQGIAFTIDDP